MSLQRVSDLAAPPELGRYYLVPTVRYRWDPGGAIERDWPVFPLKHEDAEHLNFPWQHYHVDPRFLAQHVWDRVGRYNWGAGGWAVVQGTPLQRRDVVGGKDSVPHPPIVWRRRKCYRVEIPYVFGSMAPIKAIRAHYAGQQCRQGRAGWVCPHKKYPLGSHAPDAEGVITCPLHGLRIRAADGVVVLPGAPVSHQSDGDGR